MGDANKIKRFRGDYKMIAQKMGVAEISVIRILRGHNDTSLSKASQTIECFDGATLNDLVAYRNQMIAERRARSTMIPACVE